MPVDQEIVTQKCAICGKAGVRVRLMSRIYGRGPTLLVVENVPVLVCPDCGESYLTADTLHQLEQIKRHRRKVSAPKRVAVANFSRSRKSGRRGLARRGRGGAGSVA